MGQRDALRVAVVGTGSIGTKAHIPAWARVENAEVVAVSDPDGDARKAASERLNSVGAGGARIYGSTETMLDEERPDVADVTVRPEQEKARLVRSALDAGCHVTCQKPFLHDYRAAAELVEHAEQRDRALSVNQQARFAGAFSRAEEMIANGLLGSLRTITLSADFDFAGEDRWLNFSSHSFDLIRHWAGREPERVAAWHRPLNGDKYLLGVWCDFGDLAAQIWDELGSSTTLRWEFRLMGEHGSARGHEAYFDEMIPSEIAYTPAGETTERVEHPGTRYVPDAFAAYFGALITSVRDGDEPPSTGHDNLRTLRLAFAAGESARTGGWVDPNELAVESMSL